MIMMIQSWRVFSSYCHIKRSLSLGGAKNSCGCAPKKLIMELCRTGEVEEILSRLHHYLVTTTQGWGSMEWLFSFGSSCQLSGIQQGMALDVLYRVPTPKAQLTPEAGDGGWDLTKFYPSSPPISPTVPFSWPWSNIQIFPTALNPLFWPEDIFA